MFVFLNDFLSAEANAPFSIAIMIVIMIAMLEGIGMFLGFGISAFVDNLFPEMDFEVDAPEMESASSLGRVISWIRVRGVPALVLMIIFLTSFGLSGLFLQTAIKGIIGEPLNSWIVMIPAFLVALPSVRIFGGIVAKYMPKDETSAVGLDSFIGKLATITIGEATTKKPAQGKVRDEFGKFHYLMIEPDLVEERFAQNEEVLLVKRENSVFYAIKNKKESMSS